MLGTVLWRSSRHAIKAALPKRSHTMVRKAFGYASVPLYLGNTVECPCCGWHFRKFLPAGVNGRPNARCPICSSLERERLLRIYLRDRTDLLTAPYSVLHVAPEPGLQSYLRSLTNLKYLSADLESPIAMVKMDITDIPYPDNSFDCILCMHVLEHIPDDHKAMQELARVLNSGGFAILQVPIDLKRASTYEDSSVVSPKERERAFEQEDHVRIYGRDYVQRLERAGFSVREDQFAAELSQSDRERYGLKDEAIYNCTV